MNIGKEEREVQVPGPLTIPADEPVQEQPVRLPTREPEKVPV